MQIEDQVADAFRLSVAVFHSDPLIRLGVLAALHGDNRFHIQPDGPSTEDVAGKALVASRANVTVCDFDTAAALARHSVERRTLPRMMVITSRDKESDVQRAMSSGILAYLLIGCRVDEVVDGLLAVGRGQRYLAASAAQRMADCFSYQTLTNRETDVLQFVVSGWSNKMIANELGVAEGTIKTHVKAILDKLGGRTRTEAANIAVRRGLVSPDEAHGGRSSSGQAGFQATRGATL